MPVSPALARWSIVPIAFFEAAWLASLARQLSFEVPRFKHFASAPMCLQSAISAGQPQASSPVRTSG